MKIKILVKIIRSKKKKEKKNLTPSLFKKVLITSLLNVLGETRQFYRKCLDLPIKKRQLINQLIKLMNQSKSINQSIMTKFLRKIYAEQSPLIEI